MALVCASLLAPASAMGQTSSNGGASPDDPTLKPPPPPKKARINKRGYAIAPRGAPIEVRRAIRAANRISRKPYRYGGGHASFRDSGYDCSGAVSYVLRGARLLKSPLDSKSFMSWAEKGRGRWITVYTNPGHAFIVVAGLRFDTGGRDRISRRRGRPGSGPRWGGRRSTRGYKARHFEGL